MFRNTTNILLLLTIVCSQVLSGVSCCCLARSLAVSNHHKAVVGDQTPAPRCPKCAAHASSEPTASVGQLKSSRCSSLSRSGDVRSRADTCSCVKTPLIASQSDDQVSLTVTSCGWILPAYIPALYTSLSLSSFDRFELPARFGGGTWQSIACIWRN